MFMQVFQGQVRHAEPVYVELDQWVKEIARGTTGWIRSAAGVTDDKRFIGFALWESEDDARRHAARPEQDHWWQAFTELFVDLPRTIESDDVFVDLQGDPEHAKFVQMMQGRGTNPDRARELLGSHKDEWAAFRPEILGTVGCLYDGGAYTMATYFTDEPAARAGEAKQPPPELKADMDELMSLTTGEPAFFDLRAPWLHSPSW